LEHHIRTLGTVNFRVGPNTSSSVVASLPKGTVLHVLEIVPNVTWYKARLEDGREGYITSLAKYVENFTPEWEQKAARAIAYGEKYLGTPYVFGSSRYNDKDFDCSDFMQWILENELDIIIKHDSRSQSAEGTAVDYKDVKNMRTGDLIFFDTNKDGIINHVGMFIYPNRVFHTYSTTCDIYDASMKLIRKGGGGVTYSKYEEGTSWRKNTVAVRRVIK
jgi:cell wall-associated NlpC family hydrolase